MIQSPDLNVTIEGNSKIEIKGKITGAPSLRTISVKANEVHIDLQGLTFLNSLGVKDWIDWMQTLNIKVVIHHAPKFFIDHVNVIKAFLPKGTIIESFYIPHYSESSIPVEETQVLYQRNVHFRPKQIPLPQTVKDPSGTPMAWDIVPSKFFRFISEYT